MFLLCDCHAFIKGNLLTYLLTAGRRRSSGWVRTGTADVARTPTVTAGRVTLDWRLAAAALCLPHTAACWRPTSTTRAATRSFCSVSRPRTHPDRSAVVVVIVATRYVVSSAGIPRDRFPRSVRVTSSRGSSQGCPQQVGRVGEDVTRMLRGNCCRGRWHSHTRFLARDVIYTSRAYAMMPVRLSVCL